MKLSNNWFTTVSETENGAMVIVCGRDDLELYVRSGKFKERVEIYWKYNGDSRGMPCESDARVMEPVQDALQKAMEKDKLAILTGVYTGDNERTWIFYTRNVPAFGEMLNKALSSFEKLPIVIIQKKILIGMNIMKCMSCGRKKVVTMCLLMNKAGIDILSGFNLIWALGEIKVFIKPDFIVFCTFVPEKYFL